jgi:dTDP-4-amino-4,6-dideoxygalactose transaminase
MAVLRNSFVTSLPQNGGMHVPERSAHDVERPYRVPLSRPALPPIEEVIDDVRRILGSGRLTNFGPFVREFERNASKFLSVPYAVSVSNATTGLCLLLNTLPRGSEVVLPSFTFLATVQAILWNALVPRFADIDLETFCICPESVKERITRNTSAIVAVNVFGTPCPVEELEEISRARNLLLFFDSAHALGSQHRKKYLGSFGDAEVFSVSATKVLAGCEGGVVTTSREETCQAIVNRRNYGFSQDHDCMNMGLNGKMTEFSAVMCNRSLPHLNCQIQHRNELAQGYKNQLRTVPGISFQCVPEGDVSTYKDFTILIDPSLSGISRDGLAAALGRRGIEVGTYFSPPIHRLKYFQPNSDDMALPNTNLVASRILSLPIHSQLSDGELQFVASSIKEILLHGD